MQDKQSIEELRMELQKLGRKAFPTSGMKEFVCIMKGRFYQALLPKWQQKLGAPKTTETFEELYAQVRTLERHDQPAMERTRLSPSQAGARRHNPQQRGRREDHDHHRTNRLETILTNLQRSQHQQVART